MKRKATTEEGYSFGVDQEISGTKSAQVVERLKETEDYIKNTVYKEQRYEKIRSECQNRHGLW